VTPSLLALLLLTPTALAADRPTDEVADSYATAVRLIDNLFLEPETIDASRLLAAAARGLSYDVPWLFVDVDDDGTIRLSHGDGRALGALQPSTVAALPAQLQALEGLILRAPAKVPDGLDVRIAVLDGLTGALDRYSRVLSGDGLTRFDTRLKGTLVGIGASFAWQGESLVVTRVDPAGPAEVAGVAIGDRVQRIDGRSTLNMPLTEVTARVRGDEGSTVTLMVSRLVPDPTQAGAETARTVPLTIRRAEVILPNVTHEVLDGKVGYVRIDHISQRTVHNLRQALEALRDAEALDTGLVLDLRGNTGGSMKEAARSADLFLEAGLLLRTIGHDGGRVQNLEAEMQAVDTDEEPPIPVVLLVNRRTASGSEIIAGALLEHGRSALIGTDTYGKGTVQKIYNLDDDTRLKLTVARYVLANDRRILPAGIPPDVRVGSVQLDDKGMRLHQPPLTDPLGLVVIDEATGWRGEERHDDAVRELGRRAVLRARGTTTRDALLDALALETGSARAGEAKRLAEAMEAHGHDWSPAEEEGSFALATATLVAHPTGPHSAELELEVTNDGPDPLHQAFVSLDSVHGFWDDRAVPLGRIEPGEAAKAKVPLSFPSGEGTRIDPVTVTLHADERPPTQLLTVPLEVDGRPEPAPRLDIKLVRHTPGGQPATGPHGHPVYRAEIRLSHEGPGAITGVEVYFRTPEDEGVELLDRGARHPRIGASDPERFDLTLEVAPDVVDAVQLELVADVEAFGRWLSWDVALPLDGDEVHYEAPVIDLPGLPTVAEPGPFDLPLRVHDDGHIGDTTLWVNGHKTHWFPAKGSKASATPTVTLRPGANRIAVVSWDDQGLMSRRLVSVHAAEAPSISDAEGDSP